MTLELGDHVWYWNHRLSFDQNVPRTDWFPDADRHDPDDYQGHGREIVNYVVHADAIVCGRPHLRAFAGNFAWLNNNPGNITGRLGGPRLGQYPGKFNAHRYLVFPTRRAGYAAIGAVLRTTAYTHSSILDAFLAYTPAHDGNDPVAYAHRVAARLDLPAATRVGDLDDHQLRVMQDQIVDIDPPIPGDRLAWDSADVPAEIAHLLPELPNDEPFDGVPLALLDFTTPDDSGE